MYKITWKEWKTQRDNGIKQKIQVEKSTAYEDYEEAAVEFINMYTEECPDPKMVPGSLKIFEDDKNITDVVKHDDEMFDKFLEENDIHDEFDIKYLHYPLED